MTLQDTYIAAYRARSAACLALGEALIAGARPEVVAVRDAVYLLAIAREEQVRCEVMAL